MHMFLDNFHQDVKYTTHIASHQTYLRREEKFTDQKYLSISYLQTHYLNLDNISESGRNNEIENIVEETFTFCRGTIHPIEKCLKKIRKYKGKYCVDGDSDRQRTECPIHKLFICGSIDNIITKCPKPPKDKKTKKYCLFQ